MPSRVHYGGDEALEARVDSLESGDAWTNKTTGYVPVVQSDGSIAWEAASGGGGGGSSGVGDRAEIVSTTLASGRFVLAFRDPQPNAAAVPTGWSIVGGAVVLPTGAYYATVDIGATPTADGAFNGELNFETEWNGWDNWAVYGHVGVPVVEGVPNVLRLAGVVSTQIEDALILVPYGGALATATDYNVDILLTRIG